MYKSFSQSLTRFSWSPAQRCSHCFGIKPLHVSTMSHMSTTSISSPRKVIGGNIEIQLENVYADSLKSEDYFGVKKLVKMEELFEARMHLGHKRDCWNEAFRDYLFGTRLDMDIIDLNRTLRGLQESLNVLAHLAFRGGIILLVVRPGHRDAHYVDQLALQIGEYSHTRDWGSGSFSRIIARWGNSVRVPDAVVLFSCHDSIFKPHAAIREAANLGMLTVGLVDSNCDPRLITYPVPGNDDSPSSVRHFGDLIAQSVMAGKEKRVQALKSLGIPVELADMTAYKVNDVYEGKIRTNVTDIYSDHSENTPTGTQANLF